MAAQSAIRMQLASRSNTERALMRSDAPPLTPLLHFRIYPQALSARTSSGYSFCCRHSLPLRLFLRSYVF